MFGVMFTARPERALAELVRVTRPGGRIALATWLPQGFVGAMLRAHRALVPPPAGTASPLAWGDEAQMRERLDAQGRATLGAELEWLWASHNTAPEGATSVEAEYVDIRFDRV